MLLFVPGIYEPFQNPIDVTTANRLAGVLLRDAVVDGSSRTLNYSALDRRDSR